MTGNFLDGVRYSVAQTFAKRPKILVESSNQPTRQFHGHNSLPGGFRRHVNVLDILAEYPRKCGCDLVDGNRRGAGQGIGLALVATSEVSMIT